MKTKGKSSGHILRSVSIAIVSSVAIIAFSSVVHSPNGTVPVVIPNDVEKSHAATTTPAPMPPGKIAFVSTRDGTSQIYVMNADGSNQTRLSNNPYNDLEPSFSRDGSKIAFVSDRDGTSQIYVMNSDGSNQTRLSNNPYNDLEPSFSGDGSKIAFTSDRDAPPPPLHFPNLVFVMDADGSHQTLLLTSTSFALEPSFSGDGSKIAFVGPCCDPPLVYDQIFVVNADGSNQMRLTGTLQDNFEPAFSRDGSKIAFVSGFGGTGFGVIYLMNADGSNQMQLTSSSDVTPSFSGDGSKIAFASTRDGMRQIYVMNADGSNQTRLSNNSYNDSHPSFGGRNPVIFIHGISGSRLVDDPVFGDELWLGPLSNRRRLNLYPDGNPPPSPNIKAVEVLRSALGKQLYGPLLDFLTTIGGYREYQLFPNGDPTCDTTQKNPDLFEFVYDWRQELGSTARKLKDFVQCVEYYHPGSKINILTHSMGSLLARRYILDNPTDHNVDRLITIGAPWLGAPKLFYVLETGDFITLHGIPIAAGPDVKYVMPSLPAAAQLLASRAYQTLGGVQSFVEEGWDYDNNGVDHETYDYDRVINFLNTKYPETTPGATADLFHSYTTANGAQDDWRTDTTGVDYFHFYGVQSASNTIFQTIARPELVCDNHTGCVTNNLLEPRFATGDGTVPALSASRESGLGNFNAPNARLFPITDSDDDLVEHTGLTQNSEVQNMVLTLLNGGTLPTDPFSVSRATVAPDLVPSFYVSVIGGASVIISDTHGNSTAPILGDVLGTVPGVQTFHMGDSAEEIVFPVSNTEDYSITFNSTDVPMVIKVVKGVDSVTPTEVIRYQDLVLPVGVAAQLQVTTTGVQNLCYDSDGNGTCDTVVEPTFVVTGTNALDVTPPTIIFSQVPQGTLTVVTITATDSGSGVHDVNYSTDGTDFQPYTDPLTFDRAQRPVLYAFATDNVGNRSGRITYTIATAPRPRPTASARPTPVPRLTPIPPPPSPRPTPHPRPTPAPHFTRFPTPTSPRPTPWPRPSP